MLAVDSTAVADLLCSFELDRQRAAVVRTAAGLFSAPPAVPRPGAISIAGTSLSRAQPERPELQMSPWLREAMATIAAQRARAPKDERLGDAEKLAALFAGANASRRPQIGILEDGIPSFATSVADFYIHITVDRPGRITWFATDRGQEHFSEDVPFDGRGLPHEVEELLSA